MIRLRKFLWMLPASLSVIALGAGAAAYYKSSDPLIVREGYYNFYHDATIVLAAIGLVLACTSITMILRRLVRLKD